MPFFSKVFRSKDREGGLSKSKKHAQLNGSVPNPPPKSSWEDAWLRKSVEPEEIQELIRACTHELKSRALDMPFLLLPFRPTSDPSAARSFIRNYFNRDKGVIQGARLNQELLLTEPMVLCSVMKWCWSRLPGGVVTWEAYELFRVGEQDSNMARDAFATFIPISVESDARSKIIFDFFDLMAAIAAHGKTNGMGGRKLSRFAGWWAFEQIDGNSGFDGGYKSWLTAAEATGHLFFAYLRSLSPNSVRGLNGISALPLSLQALVQDTDYPPQKPALGYISKVVMVVDSVSPTPFALLRRAKHFEYRDDDHALREFSDYEDPIKALTDECQRVLKSISSTNQSTFSTSKASTSLPDASWSRFEDIGFGGFGDYSDQEDDLKSSALGIKRKQPQGLRSTPQSKSHDLGRPTTPSWADFLSSGFVDETNGNRPAPLLLPPDKILPPIDRGQSSQSHLRKANDDSSLEPGELASINTINFDDAFWWVWISSLAGEETIERKAVFGRCALIETIIKGGKWLIMEEIVKGAAPAPEEGAYIAEKKSRFGFTARGRFTRNKSISRKPPPIPKIDPYARNNQISPMSKVSIAPDQHARIQAAAAVLQQKQQEQENALPRRSRMEDAVSTKTSSVFTLQPVIMSEAAPAMKWANSYDKNAIRAAYLGNNFAGRGSNVDLRGPVAMDNTGDINGSTTPMANDPSVKPQATRTDIVGLPRDESGLSGKGSAKNRDLPALPLASNHHPTTPYTESNFVPPAPLPSAPNHGTTFSNEMATQAAKVPLPPANPMDSSSNLAEKPLPYNESNYVGGNEAVQHISDPSHETPTIGTSQPSSPESKKENKKLSKAQGGGIKNLFGRKKSGVPNLPAPSQPADSTAVAAARAAYVGPQMKPNYNASQTKLSRRLSGIGRSKAPTPSMSSPAIHSIQDSEEQETAAPLPFTKRYEPPNGYGSQVSLSRVGLDEQQDANRQFRSFDQGPMMDQPAFVPESSPEQSNPPTPIDPGRGRQSMEYGSADATRGQEPESEPTRIPQASNRVSAEERDRVDESESDDERSDSPALDRWAQIRKNAAERAAKHNGSQTNLIHTERTDDGDADGETSGEETIESRVARIKARVAELTGNMDGQGPNRGRP